MYIYSDMYIPTYITIDIPVTFPTVAWLAHQRDAQVSHQVEHLKICISILFMFQRKPAKDDIFVRDTRSWLSRLVSIIILTKLYKG